jgi:hypothetical protein
VSLKECFVFSYGTVVPVWSHYPGQLCQSAQHARYAIILSCHFYICFFPFQFCAGYAVLRIRIGFNANPDPAFYLSVLIWIRGAKPTLIHADPDADPSQILETENV